MALPTPTLLDFATGYIGQGNRRTVIIPDIDGIADLSAPTSAEITAGTDISKVEAGLDGFTPTGNSIDFPNAFSPTVPSIPGVSTLGTGTININMSKVGGDAALALFNDGRDGSARSEHCVAIADLGLGSASNPLATFRVTCISITEPRGLADARIAQVMVSISEMGPRDVTVPNA